MARMTTLESLEQKIEKAQEQVSKTKKQYDAAIAELSVLLDKREAIYKDKLGEEFVKSGKSFEEVIAFLRESKKETE